MKIKCMKFSLGSVQMTRNDHRMGQREFAHFRTFFGLSCYRFASKHGNCFSVISLPNYTGEKGYRINHMRCTRGCAISISTHIEDNRIIKQKKNTQHTVTAVRHFVGVSYTLNENTESKFGNYRSFPPHID